MSSVELTVIPHQTRSGLNYQHLHIEILTENGVIVPQDLKGLKLPKLDYSQGVILEGKAPIWLYGYLVHECHPAAWVACYDTRLGGVVIATHSPTLNVSQVLPLDLPTFS